MAKERLGDKLIRLELITPEQLEIALKEQKRTGELLGETLLRLGFITEEQLMNALSEQKGIERVELSSYLIDPEVIKLIPKKLAEKYKIIPIAKEDGALVVGMVNPFDLEAIDVISRFAGMRVKPVAIKEKEFEETFSKYYGEAKSIEELLEEILEERVSPGELDTRIIQIVDYIILKGVKDKASDIHIEPAEAVTRVRYRIDGVMTLGFILPKQIHSSIVTRIKLISHLNISETRLPQDGRTTFKVGDREIDLRVSTLPSIYGEAVVMRLLGLNEALPKLEELDFTPHNYNLLQKAIQKPYGIILVTGPTGSGKTTTLYALLNKSFSVQKTIITVEDPVEYKWELIRQVQVNPRAGLTFAKALRSILRQDPDVILVGEIRDEETAKIATQAAQTGHLVLTTLHTNDAVSSIIRLSELGIKPFLIGSSLIAISAQRLVRKICPYCKYSYKASEEEKVYLKVPKDKELILYKGKGCEKCKFRGYLGRTVIAEILLIDKELEDLIIKQASPVEIMRIALNKGFKTMFEDGKQKVLDRETTVEELKRVLG
ncbi:GspE/PulE family protein [Desulfurobacterium thermolithotrophum]|uniref:GspE/PulE family protein n=1 Tax=Desulfurobacterium thermolithotrophum TaxID=64160 RepID=UPI0013D54476|nr:GspE/PulE family protein [Desulfurobacterium thermolithotrophum]